MLIRDKKRVGVVGKKKMNQVEFATKRVPWELVFRWMPSSRLDEPPYKVGTRQVKCVPDCPCCLCSK